MAEKIVELRVPRDYKLYLYYIDGNGSVCRKAKSGAGEAEVLHLNAVTREKGYLYFVDKDGDISRSPMAVRKPKVAAVVA